MKKLLMILMVLTLNATMMSCGGNSESAKDDMEDAADDAGDAIEDAADDAGDAMDDAADDVEDEVDSVDNEM